MSSIKLLKKKFPYKSFRSDVVLVYHPTMEMKELVDILTRQDKDLRKYDHNSSDLLNVVAMVLDQTESRKIYVVIGKGATVSDVSHECIHITAQLFKGTDTFLTSDTEETFAYTHTAVFEDIYNFIIKNAGPDTNISRFLMLPKKINQLN